MRKRWVQKVDIQILRAESKKEIVFFLHNTQTKETDRRGASYMSALEARSMGNKENKRSALGKPTQRRSHMSALEAGAIWTF